MSIRLFFVGGGFDFNLTIFIPGGCFWMLLFGSTVADSFSQ